MKKLITISIIAIIALGTSAIADAYNTTSRQTAYREVLPNDAYAYVGGAFGLTKVKDNYFEYYPVYGYTDQTDIDYNALMFQAGYQYNPYFAMEFRYWFSVSSGDVSTNTLYPLNPSAYDSLNAWGMYIKPMYPITQEFSVYGLLGFSSVTIDADYGSYLLYDDTSFSWGAGIQFDATANIALFIDYVQLYNGNLEFYEYSQDTKVNTLNFGVTYKF